MLILNISYFDFVVNKYGQITEHKRVKDRLTISLIIYLICPNNVKYIY